MDHSYSAYRDGKFVNVPPIDELCAVLKDKFLRQEEANTRLREENEKLKSEQWKDETVAMLKEENETLRAEWNRGFPISKEESEAIKKWISEREKHNIGVIGGRYEYRFLPTSIGTVGEIIDTVTKEKFTFSELG